MSFAEELKFSDLAKLLEAMSICKSIKKRGEFVDVYFQKLHKFREDFRAKNPASDSSLLPVLRLLLAQDEKERSYGLAEKTLKALYIRALKLHKDSPDAVKLRQCSEDDLPNQIFEVMKLRTSEGSLTIHEVDSALTSLSLNQKQSEQEYEVCQLIMKSSAVDQKWFVKMILKRMNMNLGMAKVLAFYHPKAHQLFLKYAHLSKVVEIIESGQAETAMIEVTRVFEPIRSMLSQKFTSQSNKEILKGEIYQETKMDGERFQLHMKNNEFRYFSRNGHEYSEGFNALLTPLIKFTPVVHSIILDGEMLVYDKIERRYHTKGETKHDVKFMKDRNSQLQPCFCAFDVLFFNDQCLLKQEYSKRHQLLAQLFTDREGVLVKTIPVKVRDVDHVVDLLNVAIENNEEGIIVKEAQSIYKPGDRNGGWYKLKADYFDGQLVKDFDCIVVGVFYENPYSKNFIQRYMLGAIEKQSDDSHNIFAIGEVVHGVTVQERSKISDRLKQHLVDYSGESEVAFGNGKIYFGKIKPDAWIPPNKSIVLECRASELEPSTSYKSNFTFRFPRIVNVRRDKLWNESCTMQEFVEMCKGNSGERVQKTVIRPVHKDDLTSPSRKRRAVTSVAGIISKIQKEECDDVKAIDNVLEGKEFCVLTTRAKLPTIKEMKSMVLKHSGSITEHPRKGKTFALIVGEVTKMVKSYINDKTYNVIAAEWLIANFQEDQTHMEMPKLGPKDFHFVTETMQRELETFYDEYGDSYTEEFETVDQLKLLLSSMKRCEEKLDLTELNGELGSLGTADRSFMRDVSASFRHTNNENILYESAKLVLQLRGGQVLQNRESQPTAVIVDRKVLHERPEDYCEDSNRGSSVDYEWILESSDAGKLLSKTDYVV